MTEKSSSAKNFYLKYALILSAVTGFVAQILSYSYDYVFAYRDSIFRMEAARRFFDSTDPGIINQIGTVWLPIPNLILMPFASVDYFFQTGIAASIVNYPAFVFSSILLFKVLKEITNDISATWIGFLIYIFNYNILYFQTTSMTEQLFLLFLTGNFYFLHIWSKTGKVKHLTLSSIFLALNTGSRYDAWPVFIASALIVLIISFYKRQNYIRDILYYSFLPSAIIIWWLIHNYIFYGDPFEFSRGKFSTLHQLKYYEEAGRLQTKNNLILSAKVYFYSVIYYSGYLYIILAIAGIIYYFIENKFKTDSFIPYILLIAVPTTLILLYKGQLIIEHPASEPQGYFNSRYGLYVFPAIAFFSGYSILMLKKFIGNKIIIILIIAAGIIIQQITFLYNFPYSIPALAEAKFAYSQASINLSNFLKDNYRGGRILYDNTVFAIHPWSKIDLKDRITFHTYILGEKAMIKPSEYVEWIIFYINSPNDKIKEAMSGNQDFISNYELKFEDNGIVVFQRKH